MESLAYIITPLLLVLLYYRSKQNLKEYEDFKKFKSTKQRQTTYRRWVLESFLIFGVGAVGSLLLVGKLDVLPGLDISIKDFADSNKDKLGDFRIGNFGIVMLAGVVTGGVVGGVISGMKEKKTGKESGMVVAGDIEALLPRNSAEKVWAGLISINAGIVEELFFRVLLPILFFIIFQSVLAALILSAIVFGLLHWYQGLMGIMMTTVMGAVFTGAYLYSGNILVPMILHALIDLNGLLLQPVAQRFFKKLVLKR